MIIAGLGAPLRPAQSPLSNAPPAPEKVSVCQLKSDPAKYNYKLVEVTGFISHGFEDFGLFDPTCGTKQSIWLDYGGKKASNTMYCCGVVPGHTRDGVVSVEKIPIPLVDDGGFKTFDRMIQNKYDLIMHATIVGRFFSGEKVRYPGGEFWTGYGHMGFSMLLMIQQVLSVDPHDRNDLDYRASADQPDIREGGCGYRILSWDWRFDKAIDLQRKAESTDRGWTFDDPRRVATELLARETRTNESSIALKQLRQSQGRVVYQWRPRKTRARYMVVVSRPYALTFYAQNPKRVAWVPIAAFKVGCGEDYQ